MKYLLIGILFGIVCQQDTTIFLGTGSWQDTSQQKKIFVEQNISAINSDLDSILIILKQKRDSIKKND